MSRSFNEPQRIGFHGILVTCNLLLLKAPFGELHFVRKKITTGQSMAQPERRPQSPQTLGRLPIPLVTMLNFDIPVVVGVAHEAGQTVCGYLVLEVDV